MLHLFHDQRKQGLDKKSRPFRLSPCSFLGGLGCTCSLDYELLQKLLGLNLAEKQRHICGHATIDTMMSTGVSPRIQADHVPLSAMRIEAEMLSLTISLGTYLGYRLDRVRSTSYQLLKMTVWELPSLRRGTCTPNNQYAFDWSLHDTLHTGP